MSASNQWFSLLIATRIEGDISLAKRARYRPRRKAHAQAAGTIGYAGEVTHRVPGDAYLVREAGPDGTMVAHVKVRHRIIDILHSRGLIDTAQHGVATELRDTWEAAGITTAGGKGRGMDGGSRGEKQDVRDEFAFKRYSTLMRLVEVEQAVCLRAVVIGDEPPDAWGRRNGCDGLAWLKGSLEALMRIGL